MNILLRMDWWILNIQRRGEVSRFYYSKCNQCVYVTCIHCKSYYTEVTNIGCEFYISQYMVP